MRLRRVDRLFHSLVVVGAALGAGGCSSSIDTQNSGAGGGPTSGGQGGGSTTGTGGADGGTTSDAGDAGTIDAASDCPISTQFFCEWTPDGTVCHCDPTAPAGPEACAHTQDFHCNEYTPVFIGCTCHPNSPQTAADCPNSDFYCAAQDPPIGCDCVVTIK